jgi:hypothetical protein
MPSWNSRNNNSNSNNDRRRSIVAFWTALHVLQVVILKGRDTNYGSMATCGKPSINQV